MEDCNMHIILLSGGAGTRLWPLSNSARSKQFLKLLTSPDGSLESIVQRLFRQLKNVGLNKSVLVSTNATQKDSFLSQIGSNLEIIAEPCRRDTFAAIILACTYLHDVQHLLAEEPIIVMPCDQYVDESYFDCIKQIASQVATGYADLVLMGIKPTYPSTKFGYIMPSHEMSGKAFKVDGFKEKPTEIMAEKYIRSNALWNGGVFGFKLGFVINIVKQYFNAIDFNIVYHQFKRLPKISFDYQVVERTKNIEVVEYDGSWDDLGTWSSLAVKTSKSQFGNVTATSTCVNSLIANELNIPIICSGLSDMVVVASYDGILVSRKDESEGLKKYVADLPTRPLYEERRWGTYKVVDAESFPNGLSQLTKNIVLKPGCSISYQVHQYRSEVWTIVNGTGLFVLDGVVKEVGPGDVLVILSKQKHAIKAKTELTMIEVQLGTELVESDIERFDWNW